jgi:hypothetical protein
VNAAMSEPTDLGYGRGGQALFFVVPVLRTAVHAVFLDRKELVLLGDDGNELARKKTDRPAARLAEVFTRHGYKQYWRRADRSVGS